VKFHHLGIACKDFKNLKVFYKRLNYSIGQEIYDRLQNVKLVFCKSAIYPNIELIKPVNKKSPINNILKLSETSIYHLCYSTKKSEKDVIEFFKNQKIIKISGPLPAVLFNNKKVAFYYVKNVGIIEILYL